MLHRIRSQFSTAALVLSVVALLAALTGGALAASSADHASLSKAKKGPRGPKGPAGPAGPQGPVGPQGSVGPQGAAGADGTNGTNGTNGTSVTSEEFVGVKEGHCAGAGGSKFAAANGNTFACNGKEGSPWTVGGTLPSGETEVGTWATLYKGTTFIPISLTLPVVPAPEPIYVTGASATGCPGIVSGVPTADPGKLCIYRANPGSASVEGFPILLKPVATEEAGATPAGTVLLDACAEAECNRYGMWAVTAA